ncbi:hypothetical protein ACHHYP_16609 [Achlya hypogyna]|uniref:Thioesterase n=1 Tax=Achlya hypogyna TaxID=1202772 RepID=A0A1V9Y6C4_ACHHY|nr:hypothetical protein ACHHYP_16609 [Achlya hypogyna]
MTIPRILWNMGAGLLRHSVARQRTGLLLLDRPSVWKSRIGLIDTDLAGRMSPASYLTQMESATWFAVGASGILHEIVRKRWLFLVVAQALRYEQPLTPLRPFHVQSRIVFWDDAWLYLQHTFVCPATGSPFAEAVVRVTIRRGKTTVPPATMYQTVANDTTRSFDPPPIPEVVRSFLAWDASCAKGMQAFTAPAPPENATSVNWAWQAAQ